MMNTCDECNKCLVYESGVELRDERVVCTNCYLVLNKDVNFLVSDGLNKPTGRDD